MVFIGGPRQVGKTFLAREFLTSDKALEQAYFSWDDLKDRELLKKHLLPKDQPLLIFDEIHKYQRWRTLLKGLYDKRSRSQEILVTGSARLDQFRKGGDSLFGRYHYIRLHPLSLPELHSYFGAQSMDMLLRFGGFPEPLTRQTESFSKIWRRERTARVIYEDLRDLTNLRNYSSIELLADALPQRVGSLLSLNSLGEDLERSSHTIRQWMEVLESVYLCYRVYPYGPPRIRAVKKQAKAYLWDWSSVENLGPRFENCVASHLLKYCHFVEDTQGDQMDLRFLRDHFDREIDFVVLKNKKPIFAVEVKTGDRALSGSIRHFQGRVPIPKFYQVHLGQRDEGQAETGRILPFATFCKLEGLV